MNCTTEIEKWRRSSNGEEESPCRRNNGSNDTRSSNVVHCNSPPRKIPPSLKMSAAKQQPTMGFYITLAKESPRRLMEDSEGDSTDGSIHGKETDICRDPSDTDSSYTTDGFATIDIREYEVATASGSEVLFSDDSSSGSDEDYLFTALAFSAKHYTSLRSAPADLIDVADLADTEHSDTEFDPELSAADYWICVKCKNKQNNPMYRYCERCYQIRKTHFPPRPRHRQPRKKNTSNDRTRNRKRKFEQTQQDSGVSSAPASQDPVGEHSSSTSESNEFVCSQDTVEGDLDEDVLKQFQESDESDFPIPAKRHMSDLTGYALLAASQSTTSPHRLHSPDIAMQSRSNRLEGASTDLVLPHGAYGSDFGNDLQIAGSSSGNCIICLTEPKNGVFVHSRFLHLCCCYRCAVKVWNRRKRCPICNCTVKNVMKLFVH